MTTLFIEAFSGISGDMFLGALAGLTDAYDELEYLPKLLNLPDGKVEISTVNKNGIVCKHVRVIDLNAHDHSHHHHDDHDHAPHRHLSEINKIIEEASISENAKNIAKDIFLIIGNSESKIHDMPLETIHFHEISGVDSIIDIVGSAVLIDKLNFKKTYATPVCTGFGFVNTQHGRLPVPAPATADILIGIPTYAGDEKGERTTPTGAAILKYLNPDFEIPVLNRLKTVYGPGTKDFIAPNVVRLSLCESITEKSSETFIIETNIDDMPCEFLGQDFQNGLFEQGANDFHTCSIQMKKGRQGILLSCSVAADKLEQLSNYLFEHTSTIGLRYYPIKMNRLARKTKIVDTQYGKVKIKVVQTPSGKEKVKIEYDDLMKIHKKTNISLQVLQADILKNIR